MVHFDNVRAAGQWPLYSLQMSIAERLGEMDLSTMSANKGVPKGTASLQTDSFAVLLVQGLESNDASILNVCVQDWLH